MKPRPILFALTLMGSTFAVADGNWELDSTYTYTFTKDVATFHDVEGDMGGDAVAGDYGWGSASSFDGTIPDGTFGLSFDTAPFDAILGTNLSQPILEQSFFFGVMDALPTDAPGQQHLVLFMNPTAASNVQDIAYGTLFGTSNQPYQYTEETVIDALEKLHDPTIADGDKGEYRTIVDNFRDAVAKNANVGPDGAVDTAWFMPSEGFSIVTFSDGNIVGSGTNTYTTRFTPLPTPEPAPLIALATGALALLRRRRR